MICRNCGNEIHENEKFCPNCGTKCEEYAYDNNGYDNNGYDNNGYDNNGYDNNAYDNSGYENNEYYEEYEDEKPSLFSKKKLISIAAVVLVLLVAVVAFAGDAIKNFAYRTIMSPSSYLKYVQEKNMDDVTECVDEIGGLIDSLDFSGKTLGADVGITLGNYVKNVIAQNVDPEVLPYVSWINDASLGFNAKFEAAKIGADIDLALNGTHITEANALIDMSEGNVYISLPDISDKAMRISTGATSMDAEFKQLNQLMEIIPDEDVISDILCRYAGVITSQMKNVTRSKSSVTADGVSQKCTQLTVAIDGVTAMNIVKAVLTEAKDDDAIKNLVSEVAKFYGENPEEVINSYNEGIATALDELASEEAPEFEEIPYIDLWVDNDANIIGGSFRYNPIEFSLKFAEAGKKDAMTLSFKAPETTFEINGSSGINSGKKSGKYIASFNGMSVVEVMTENIDTKKLDDGDFEGKITVSVADAASGLIAMTDMDEEMQKLLLDGRIEIDSKDSRVSINLYTADELIAGVSLASKEAKDIDLSAPADFVDENASEEFAKTVRLDTVIDALVKAGAPAELSSLAALIASSNAEPETADDDMNGISSDGMGVVEDVVASDEVVLDVTAPTSEISFE